MHIVKSCLNGKPPNLIFLSLINLTIAGQFRAKFMKTTLLQIKNWFSGKTIQVKFS